MPRIAPWLSMWFSPKKTIRWVVETNPRYGVFWLSSIYIFQSLLFFLNFWSLGFTYHPYMLLIPSIIAAPLLGTLWVHFYGWILYLTGSWLGGSAPNSYLRASLAWSRLPMICSLILWCYLWLDNPDKIFIQYEPGPTILTIQGLSICLQIWSLVLFVQSIREIQQFSLLKALINILISWAIYSTIILLAVLLIRFLSIYFS